MNVPVYDEEKMLMLTFCVACRGNWKVREWDGKRVL